MGVMDKGIITLHLSVMSIQQLDSFKLLSFFFGDRKNSSPAFRGMNLNYTSLFNVKKEFRNQVNFSKLGPFDIGFSLSLAIGRFSCSFIIEWHLTSMSLRFINSSKQSLSLGEAFVVKGPIFFLLPRSLFPKILLSKEIYVVRTSLH